jgi:small-conductance mechanosensitive channel
LLAVADEHGLVLKQPEPEVRFESFGEKALNFALLYWFDIRKASRDSLASDLHFMIEKTFAEADLRIAGAQNEVTLGSARPLRVEISRPPETESKP